jgi:hypothetical protein
MYMVERRWRKLNKQKGFKCYDIFSKEFSQRRLFCTLYAGKNKIYLIINEAVFLRLFIENKNTGLISFVVLTSRSNE